MLPKWRTQYSVNHSVLDAQHQELFRLAEQVYGLSAQDATKERIRKLMGQFYMYMKKHFGEEEAYMEHIGYPDLEAHRKHHEKIVEGLNEIIQKSHGLQEVREKLKMIVRVWLVKHILEIDMAYEKWRKSNRKKEYQQTAIVPPPEELSHLE